MKLEDYEFDFLVHTTYNQYMKPHFNTGRKRPDMIGNKFSEGRKPWNKGLTGLKTGFAVHPQPEVHPFKGKTKETYEPLMRISKHHKDSGNPIWNGGVSKSYLDRIVKEYGLKREKCSWCGFKRIGKNKPGNNYIIIHHKDGDRRNNKKSNLVVICQSCHVKHHKPRYGTGKK